MTAPHNRSSRGTTALLAPEERRLDVGRPYPLSIDDADDLRKKLSAAQAKIGREPGATGSGNSTKRIRLVLEAASLSPKGLEDLLAAGGTPSSA